ncbi:MAG: alpha/beta hydrolase [Alphaproteobacteria bacterium]|nr:alpha/beta hydrolase [Alphaproteobacteria bacterium]
MPEVIFNGPEGRLEGLYSHHEKEGGAPIALLLHPYPREGGTMNNRVIYRLYQTFSQKGFSTLRFNFRGVGRSQGSFDNGAGELSDAAAALDWVQSQNPNAPQCWVAGFSFGAWIGMQLLMRRPEISGFISIAPPVNLFDFNFLAPCPTSGLIIHGRQDEVVPEEAVAKLANKLSNQKGIEIDYRVIPAADHLFSNKLDQLLKGVESYLGNALKDQEAEAG